jgi:O-antigen ligase
MGLPKRIDIDTLLWYGYAGMFFSVPLATSPTVICGVFVLSVWVISGRFIKDFSMWRNSRILLPVIILAILPWIGLLYTPSLQDGLGIARKSYYWFYAAALAPVLTMRKQSDLIIKMFLAGLWLNSAISICQFARIVPLREGVATGLIGGSSSWIAFSLLLTTGIVIASFYFLKAQSKRERLLYLFLMLQYFVTLGFVGGRSGYLALIVLSPLIACNIIGQRHFAKILIVSIVAVALLFSFPTVRSRFAKAAEDIELYQQGNVNTSVGLRFHIWEIAIKEIKRSPFLGVGTAGFQKSWEIYKEDPALPFISHPHNSFLFVMVSYGILGLLAFCQLLFLMLCRGWKHRGKPLGFAVFAFTMVFAIGSVTDTEIIVFATATALPLFAGIAGAIDES